MSFADILKKARSEAAEISKIQKSAKQLVDTPVISKEETHKVIEKKQEVKTEIKPDIPANIGQAIIGFAMQGIQNSKKLKTTNKCKRIAKHLAKGECTSQQLIKAHEHIQKLKSPHHGDFLLCGGWATVEFFKNLKPGVDVSTVLKQTFKGPSNYEK